MDLEKNQYESNRSCRCRTSSRNWTRQCANSRSSRNVRRSWPNEAQRNDARRRNSAGGRSSCVARPRTCARRLAELNRQEAPTGAAAVRNRRAASGRRRARSPQGDNQGERGRKRRRARRRASNAGGAQDREIAEALASVQQAPSKTCAPRMSATARSAQAGEAARKAGQNLRRALKDGSISPRRRVSMRSSSAWRSVQAASAEEQSRVESELYQALSRTGRSEQFSTRGVDRSKQSAGARGIEAGDGGGAERIAGRYAQLRARAPHRDSPKQQDASGEIIGELEKSDVMYRLNRSAAEIYYGRAREAALREGLIGEALETLERDLREASALAAREGEQGKEAQATSRNVARRGGARCAGPCRLGSGAKPQRPAEGAARRRRLAGRDRNAELRGVSPVQLPGSRRVRTVRAIRCARETGRILARTARSDAMRSPIA